MTINTGISIGFLEGKNIAFTGIDAFENSWLLLKVGFDENIRVN